MKVVLFIILFRIALIFLMLARARYLIRQKYHVIPKILKLKAHLNLLSDLVLSSESTEIMMYLSLQYYFNILGDHNYDLLVHH